jgi:hypothetical protein
MSCWSGVLIRISITLNPASLTNGYTSRTLRHGGVYTPAEQVVLDSPSLPDDAACIVYKESVFMAQPHGDEQRQAALRWYEIQHRQRCADAGAAILPARKPGVGLQRWMGSLAVDRMATCHWLQRCQPDGLPSIRVAGRLRPETAGRAPK